MENQIVKLPNWVGFPKTKDCESCGRPFQANSPISKYCKECRKLKQKEYQKDYHRKKSWLIPKSNQVITPEICWWCLAGCKPGEICQDCGQPYDLKKAIKVAERQAAGYLNIVARNAIKDGKDVNKEMKRIRDLQTFGGYGSEQGWKETSKALSRYLKRKKVRQTYNNRVVGD